MARNRTKDPDAVVVVGLGRFGGAVADALMEMGHEVLAIDEREDIVQDFAARLTHVVQANTTNIETLRRLGVEDFSQAIVAIGSDIEASLMTVLALSELGIPTIWAKALTRNHGKLLERTGAHQVIYPETTMGERVAHMMTGRMIDFNEFDEGFAIAKTAIAREFVGKTLADSALRTRHAITVVAVKRSGQAFVHATADTRFEAGDQILIAGTTEMVERFAAIA